MSKAQPKRQIYTRQQWEQLKAAQRQVHDLQITLDKMEACDMDCQAFRALSQDLSRRFALIERNFMSPTPH